MVIVRSSGTEKVGRGILNTLINKLPIEVHVPGYRYCGPGTKLKKRLARGDPGINGLDEACKEHDIAYDQTTDVGERNQADKILAEKAWARVKARDATLGERATAWAVTNTMKTKSKLGMGCKNKNRKSKRASGDCVKKKKRKIPLQSIISAAKKQVKSGGFLGLPLGLLTSNTPFLDVAFKAAIEAVKKIGGKGNVSIPKVVPIPIKTGGILPLIPIFAGLSALGALAGGASGIAKAVNSANAAKRGLEEAKRHNEKMEAIALGKGLHLKPFKNGIGLYFNKSKN